MTDSENEQPLCMSSPLRLLPAQMSFSQFKARILECISLVNCGGEVHSAILGIRSLKPSMGEEGKDVCMRCTHEGSVGLVRFMPGLVWLLRSWQMTCEVLWLQCIRHAIHGCSRNKPCILTNMPGLTCRVLSALTDPQAVISLANYAGRYLLSVILGTLPTCRPK